MFAASVILARSKITSVLIRRSGSACQVC
jgi:hypothetical protein